MEEYPGRITMSSYPGDKGGILLNEDDTQVLCETETNQSDDIQYFVSEESTQIGSYNLISEDAATPILIFEDGGKILDETNTHDNYVAEMMVGLDGVRIIDESGNRFLSEDALMIGRKESNQSGPTIGDLSNMMFTENYRIMQKVQLDGGSGVSSGDDLLLETGEHMLQESPSEGMKISDISSIYPNRLISNLERELGRKTNFIHSAVVQTG